MQRNVWVLSLIASIVWATDWAPNQHRLYQQMVREFHCLMCSQESLVDSCAPFAIGLRGEIRRIVNEGGSEERVVEYITYRYGGAIDHRPVWQEEGLLLWLAPPIVWLAAVRRVSRLQRRYNR